MSLYHIHKDTTQGFSYLSEVGGQGPVEYGKKHFDHQNWFSFTFLRKFSCICNFAIFVWIFMKFSPKYRTKKLGMIYTILGSFCSFILFEIQPQIRPRKIPVNIFIRNLTTPYNASLHVKGT